MTEPRIGIRTLAPGVGRLTWRDDLDPSKFATVLTDVTEVALDGAYRRLEAEVAVGQPLLRRAFVRAGFRLEGVRRQAVARADGGFDDVALFARLADDSTTGPGGWSGVMNSLMPRKRLIAHVVIRDQDDRILLCETTFKADWELPGGIVEPGETPRAGAIREIREELGIVHPVGAPLVCDWMPPYLGWEDAVELIFDGGRIDAADVARFTLDQREIRSVRFVPVPEAERLLTPLGFRRLSVAAGLRPGSFAYTEDGRASG